MARFNGEPISGDGVAALLREPDTKVGLLERVAEQFNDYRDPELIKHSVSELLAQRIIGLALATALSSTPT